MKRNWIKLPKYKDAPWVKDSWMKSYRRIHLKKFRKDNKTGADPQLHGATGLWMN